MVQRSQRLDSLKRGGFKSRYLRLNFCKNLSKFRRGIRGEIRGVRWMSQTFQLKLFYFGSRLLVSVQSSVVLKQQWCRAIDQPRLYRSQLYSHGLQLLTIHVWRNCLLRKLQLTTSAKTLGHVFFPFLQHWYHGGTRTRKYRDISRFPFSKLSDANRKKYNKTNTYVNSCINQNLEFLSKKEIFVIKVYRYDKTPISYVRT